MSGQSLEAFAGANYSGASADIDADGDLDTLLSDPPSFLLNDGNGSFHVRRPVEGLDQFLTAAELVDVDRDGYADILAGGHESETASTQLIWGDSTGVYGTSRRSILPAAAGYGVILDIDVADVDGDGSRDIVISRTGDGTGVGFYVGYYLRLVVNIGGKEFRDATAERISDNRDDRAGPASWIRLYDPDGDSDVDIVVDDYSGTGLLWVNGGGGRFRREG